MYVIEMLEDLKEDNVCEKKYLLSKYTLTFLFICHYKPRLSKISLKYDCLI